MNATAVHTAPVAIIGGGPVGLMLALFLDGYGVPVVLFNSESETRWNPKGSTHNSRTMEHYRRVGIADAVRTLGMPADHPRDITYFTRLNGWELARFAMPSEQQRMQEAESTLETDQVPEPLLRANQMYVERYLLEQVRHRKNITLRFGWQVNDFSQDENGVSIQAVNANGAGAVEHWRCGYMVGCDGGQSFVRRSLGISFDGVQEAKIGFLSGRMLSSHLRIPALHESLLVDKKAWMYNVMAPDLRMLLISLNGNDEFLMMSQAKASDEIAGDATTNAAMNATMIKRIHEGIGMHLDVSVLAHATWNGGVALVAERFSDKRVFLAGDATHLFSPTGGFGMNTGIGVMGPYDHASVSIGRAWNLCSRNLQGGSTPGDTYMGSLGNWYA
ncbi:MAG: FAD-dependent monooxygenase, partial [Glaciimonas sp.]|nr:FAD-dependent monooxygenase [Glaciimonas sp.]